MILALETSCDDTCVAVVSPDGDVLSNIVSSQHDIHEEFQGVVPELASRRHCEMINFVLVEALEQADVTWEDISSVAVTYGPGLVGSLLTGIAAAKSVSARFDCDLIPVNHIEGHIYSLEIEQSVDYPYVSLVASGGHTALFLVRGRDDYEILGHTQDDAAGEAYDKVAKMLDLGYPGGPEIERCAEDGDETAIDFPRPTLTGSPGSWHTDHFDFSFSGLKTAVYYHLNEYPDSEPTDVAASFQRAVNDTLVHKTLKAARDHGVDRICVGGGVAANGHLRELFQSATPDEGSAVLFPTLKNCTDNAAMIGHRATDLEARAALDLNAQPNLSTVSPKDPKEEAVVE
jgi:N6-L-threonylcarbamoyladenine synthase